MDDTISKFLKTLIEYFKPSNNLFSYQELIPDRQLPAYVTVGLDLIDWLLSSHSVNIQKVSQLTSYIFKFLFVLKK